MPFIIYVRKISSFCSLFVVIKIKYYKSTFPIRQQRIYTDYIRTIFFISYQMCNYFSCANFRPFLMFTFIAKYFFTLLLGTKTRIPAIIALWKISTFLSSFRINIFSSPKHRKETYCHFLCNK